MLPGVRGGSPSTLLSGSGGEQFRQSREVERRHRQREAGLHALDAAIQGLRHAADRFGPAERFLDRLPAPLRLGVTGVPGGSAANGAMSGLLGDMRRDHHLA